MNATTELVFKKKLYFPTKCVGVGSGRGFKTLEVDIRLETQLCKDWETLEEKRMYVFGAYAHAPRMWGQCLDYIHDNAEQYIVPDEMKNLYNRIYHIWKEYHLNDLQSGTKKQTEHLTKELHRADHYTEACEYLKGINLFEDRGYQYGHGWLCKEIPEEIVAEIMTWQNI
jgi:hypothetical protein